MKTAGFAKQLNPFPAIGRQWVLFNTIVNMQPKGRKAAPCLKFFGGIKQRLTTGGTHVQACGFFVFI
jgi:hypothetical protein